MSEEMNLYKRCKNIFKFHGVDMGSGGGESGIVFVNLTIDAEHSTVTSADKTITELVDAYFSGRMVSVNIENDYGITSIPLYNISTSPDMSTLMFGHITFVPETGEVSVMVVGIHDQSGDKWVFENINEM